MKYCRNCGKKLDDNDNFCPACGFVVKPQSEKRVPETSPKGEQQSSYSERKQEYAGHIIKCPACGEELPSFTAVCPSCGHEVNSQSVSSEVKQFIEAINECDKLIANDPEPLGGGWKTWSKGLRIAWIVLNIITVCIPLVAYLVFSMVNPILFPDKPPKLSVAEKQKAALIENSVFPNERESTLEAMMFIKSKIAFLASEKLSPKTTYWANIWYTKAEQLNHRANIILKNDEVVKGAYEDISVSKAAIRHKQKARARVGIAVIAAYVIVVLAVLGSLFGKVAPQGNPKHPNIGSQVQSTDENGITATATIESGGETDTPRDSQPSGNIGVSDNISVQENNYLALKEFGWFISDGYMHCVVTITNKSNEYAIEFPTFRVTAYGKNGEILGTEEQVLSLIYPEQDFSCYCLLFDVSEEPDKVNVTLLDPAEYSLTPVILLEHPVFKQMIGQNVSVRSESVTGEIFNPNDYDIDSALVTIIFKTNDGKIVFGAQDYIGKIPAGGTTPFEVWTYLDGGLPSNCEVYAYFW